MCYAQFREPWFAHASPPPAMKSVPMPKTARPSNAAHPRPARTKGAPNKRKKISKRLEKIARQIKDSDEFVSHVAGLCNLYGRELALRAGPAQAAMRQSTRVFHKHALALAAWLQRAHESNAD